ncbi:hypothetical protein McanCB56680_000540 [Microsporum canis]
MTIGTGLLSTFDMNTGPAKWVGYQVLYRLGLGLARDIRTSLPEVNLDRISNSGTSDLRDVASGLDMVKLLQAYNEALRYVFYLVVAVSGLSLAGASLVEWKNLIKVEKEHKAGKVRLSGIVKDQLPKG